MKREHEIKVTDIPDELITRYLAGEATPEEARALHDALAHPVFQERFSQMETVWNATHPRKKPRAAQAEEAWAKVHGAMQQAGTQTPSATGVFWQRHLFLFKVAASVAVILMAGAVLFISVKNENTRSLAVATGDSLKVVHFPDRSRATLHHNTSILYPEVFETAKREIQLLKGEAFFSVEADKSKPFIIHTALADIQVVGTSFNVALEGGQLQVVVQEGRVVVQTAQDTTYLEAGATGVVRKEMNAIAVTNTVNSNVWGYATRKFTFKDVPLAEVIPVIEKAYPYSIKLLSKEINNCKLTATFDNVSIEKMLNLIAETLNLSVNRNGTVFILEGEGCP